MIKLENILKENKESKNNTFDELEEDIADIKAYEAAMKEFNEDSTTYSLEDAIKMIFERNDENKNRNNSCI